MKATITKKQNRHSKSCDAGHRRQIVEVATFWVSHFSTRHEGGTLLSQMVIGDYTIEMDDTTIAALATRLQDILVERARVATLTAKLNGSLK